MIAPATWEAVGVRAVIGCVLLSMTAIGMAAYAAGYRAGRRTR